MIVLILIGGAALILMGVLMFSKSHKYNLSFDVQSIKGEFKYGAILGGIFFSAFNPTFPLWWGTIGASLLSKALLMGVIGVVVLSLGHWLADLVWYISVSFAVAGGKRFVNQSIELISKHCSTPGKFLVLGCGAGRETYDLAKIGFVVTGIDFIEELLNRARAVAEKEKLNIKYLNREVLLWASQEAEEQYDYILLSNNVYGQIPTKKRRINFIKKALRKLSYNGLFIIINNRIGNLEYSPKLFKFKRLLAKLTFGNIEMEPGDTIPGRKFFHRPQNKDEFISEFKEFEDKIYKIIESRKSI